MPLNKETKPNQFYKHEAFSQEPINKSRTKLVALYLKKQNKLQLWINVRLIKK